MSSSFNKFSNYAATYGGFRAHTKKGTRVKAKRLSPKEREERRTNIEARHNLVDQLLAEAEAKDKSSSK